MNRHTALQLLVDRACSEPEAIRIAAQMLGVTRQAVYAWPVNGHLPRQTADKVLAMAVRRRVALLVKQRAQVSPAELDAVTLPE